MNPGEWERAAQEVLADLTKSQLDRHRRLVTPIDATHVLLEGRTYLNFASNNYLGLSHHPKIVAAIQNAAREFGAGSGASPLITGYGPAQEQAERHIASWKGTESAVLLPSGYQANHAAVQTLAAIARKSGRGLRFLLDKLAHASLIDAVRGTGVEFRAFPHNGIAKLERLLSGSEAGQMQVVVTESVFSMDGDTADLNALAELKQRHPFFLLLDEAHATGVYGQAGSGFANESGLRSAVDASVITFSKAMGVSGGAVCGSNVFSDALVNLGRAYVYSTGVPPMIAAGAVAAIAVMQTEPAHQSRVRHLALRLRSELARTNWQIPEGDSPIIPIVIGSEANAIAAAESLRKEGILALAIRPPTVPRGASRLRVTISAAHTDEEIGTLIGAIRGLPTPG